jgi:hypothetical protein
MSNLFCTPLSQLNERINSAIQEKATLEQKIRALQSQLSAIPVPTPPSTSSMTVPVFTFALVMVTFLLGRGLRAELGIAS